ncbi:inositol polyphosphate 5-phosphatase [Linnemannia hyalina]|uniref:Inositol polyphosphate 5-phosphatase n=1 Tax=Linnemannia hyalina TaxID=64524 RepID=A0A9P7Y4V6_9FUNG|nr:inositol polyphosphate 5-phosphatase [Linnemannia hyalina]
MSAKAIRSSIQEPVSIHPSTKEELLSLTVQHEHDHEHHHHHQHQRTDSDSDSIDLVETDDLGTRRINFPKIVRAIQWVFNGPKRDGARKVTTNDSTWTSDKDQDSDVSSQEIRTDKHRRKKRRQSAKSLPAILPRPTISKTRLKVFVGTWNMMGQMPNIRDGLTGFLDIDRQQEHQHQHQQSLLDPSLRSSPSPIPSSTPSSNPSSNPPNLEKPLPQPPHPATYPLEQVLMSSGLLAPGPTNSTAHSNRSATESTTKNTLTPPPPQQSVVDSDAPAPHKSQKRRANDLLNRIRHPHHASRTDLSSTPSSSGNQRRVPDITSASGSAPGILKAPFLEMNTKAPYHIIAINTQECEREIREAVLFPSKNTWEKHLQTSLGPDYVMIKTETMAALHIAVFIWKPIEDLVSGNIFNLIFVTFLVGSVDSSTVATGIGGIVGNKGAVAISVYLGSTSLLIIQELHLNEAPKRQARGWHFKGDMKLRRHYNYPPVYLPKPGIKNNNGKAKASSTTNLLDPNRSPVAKASSSSAISLVHPQQLQAKGPQPPQQEPYPDVTDQFDYTFWAGDLNYRVDLSREKADECLQKGDLETMLAHDQLSIQKTAGAIFDGFMEAPIKFKPTYKAIHSVRRRRSAALDAIQTTGNSLHQRVPSDDVVLSGGHAQDAVMRQQSPLSATSLPDESIFGDQGRRDSGDDEMVARPVRVQTLELDQALQDKLFSDAATARNGPNAVGGQNGHLAKEQQQPLTLEQKRQRLLQMVRYDSSSKQRVPSWTDRILWKATGGNFYLPIEIGDDTRSENGNSRGWSLLRKTRSRAIADGATGSSPRTPGGAAVGDEDNSGGVGGGPTSPNGFMMKLGMKKTKDSSAAPEGGGKMSLLESLRMEFHSATSRSSRRGGNEEGTSKSLSQHAAAPQSPAPPLMSEDDENRAAVLVKQYTAHHDIGLFSDHRPVTAVFAVRFDWKLTDRGGVIGNGNGVGNGLFLTKSHRTAGERWGPLDKVLERIINDRLGDTHIHSSSASTTTTTISTAEALDSEAKRLRTANATEDDNRRGKRMMGMILGTLTQFKRQARTVVPRVAVPPVNNVNATAVVGKTDVVESRSGPRASSTATATVSTAATAATETVTTTTTTAAVSRRDDNRAGRDVDTRAGRDIDTRAGRDVDTRAGRDADSRGASDSDIRGIRDIDSRGAKDVGSRSVRDSDSRKDGGSRRGRDDGNARIPSAPALDVRRLSEPELDIAPPTAPAADLGRASREAVQERVREKLRMEKEANEDRLRKERADREARLRETLLKQIAGRSSVPGRRRTAVGAPAAATTGPSSPTPPVHLSRRSRDARYENGYLMTETKPRLRYMPKVMNEATREKFDRQVEDNSDQRAIPKRGAPPPPRREDADMSSSKSRTPTAPAVIATATAVGKVDFHMQEDRYGEEDGEPSAEAVAKAEAEAERELDAGMDLGLEGSANDDFRRREVPTDSTREEAQNSEASGSSSVTVSGSPATVRDGAEDVAMEE